MTGPSNLKPRAMTSLSARLLALTVIFFMLSEILILLPSMAGYRRDFLREKLADAHLAALALEGAPNGLVSQQLERELLSHAGAYGVVLHRPDNTVLMLVSPALPKIDAVYDLRHVMFPMLIADAIETLSMGGNRIIRVLDTAQDDPDTTVEVLLDEKPLLRAMRNYGERVLIVSVVTSLIASLFLYFSMQWLVVSRLRQLTNSMMAFRDHPEDANSIIKPSRQRDEIGLAQRELAEMQETVRGALRQNERLAALGTAVNKISHDLKNMLSVVRLLSDRLANSEVPEVKRVMPNLIQAIDRAVALCVGTLNFTRDGGAPLYFDRVGVRKLVAELTPMIENGGGADAPHLINEVPDDFVVKADRTQLFRVLLNLASNAVQAGAKNITASSHAEDGWVIVTLADDGPGLPPKARENLFRPFAGSARAGGMGLGLAIAREVMRAHGGDITLGHTGATGTAFRLSLPQG